MRSDFQDTAYWQAVLQTDAAGRATIEIPLPDNLTTWRLHAKAISAETLVGQATIEVQVNKPLLLRPSTPRFFTVGDIAQIGTVINNNSPTDQTVTTWLEANGIELLTTAEQELVVPANDSIIAWWPVRVQDVKMVDLTFYGQSEQYTDASKPTFGIAPDQLIPVYRYNAEDIVATSGVLAADERRVEAVLLPAGLDPDSGTLSFRLNASLAAAVLDSLSVLEDQPYDNGCAHGVAARLLPNAVTARTIATLGMVEPELVATLDELNLDHIDRLTQLQKFDGGWGWCYATDSDAWFSAYILLAFDKAQEAGYTVPAEVIDRGLVYLQQQIVAPQRLNDNAYTAGEQAFFHYVLAEWGAANGDQIDALIAENRPLLAPHAKAMLLIASDLAGGDSSSRDTLLADLNSEAIVSATGAHWENARYSSFGRDIFDTAAVIMAIATVDTENPFGPQAVNWLMGARQARLWGTHYESSWVLLALTDWLAATGELDANFAYAVTVNQALAAEAAYDRDAITRTDEFEIPLGDLNGDDLNLIDIVKQGEGRLYYNGYLDAFINADLVDAINRGVIVERTYYDAACDSRTNSCEPITSITAGQQVRVELNIIATRDLVYAVIEDYFPAGAEALDPNLPTSPQGAGGQISPQYGRGYWGWWYFNRIQYRDERITFTSNFLPRGSYKYTYTLQAILPGEYQVRPAFAHEEFTPEVNGRSDGMLFVIEE